MDNIHVKQLKAKIEQFKLDTSENNIVVIYRLGRQKLLHKMNIQSFERDYFEKISNYDQHRLTKFSTMQSLLQMLFQGDSCRKKALIEFIQEIIKDDNLL